MIKSYRKLIFIVTIVAATGCGIRNINTPSENLPSYRYFERANTSETTTKQDMRDCHLGVLRSMIVTSGEEISPSNKEENRRWIMKGGGDQLLLTKNQYIQGYLCMEAKGYNQPKFGNICDGGFKIEKACQEYLQKKK